MNTDLDTGDPKTQTPKLKKEAFTFSLDRPYESIENVWRPKDKDTGLDTRGVAGSVSSGSVGPFGNKVTIGELLVLGKGKKTRFLSKKPTTPLNN